MNANTIKKNSTKGFFIVTEMYERGFVAENYDGLKVVVIPSRVCEVLFENGRRFFNEATRCERKAKLGDHVVLTLRHGLGRAEAENCTFREMYDNAHKQVVKRGPVRLMKTMPSPAPQQITSDVEHMLFVGRKIKPQGKVSIAWTAQDTFNLPVLRT